MKYENIKEFKVTTKVSKSKIYRFYKKNEELWSETMLKGGKRLFPVDHARCDLDLAACEKCRHGLQVRAIGCGSTSGDIYPAQKKSQT
jgi:hypothetical protein